MSKFVLIYTGGSAMAPTPEEIDAQMAAWGAWFESMGSAVIDAGNPFGGATTVTAAGSTEGAPSTAGGYSIIEAPDMAAAVALAGGSPAIQGGGSVEVHMALDM